MKPLKTKQTKKKKASSQQAGLDFHAEIMQRENGSRKQNETGSKEKQRNQLAGEKNKKQNPKKQNQLARKHLKKVNSDTVHTKNQPNLSSTNIREMKRSSSRT